jgi:GxxExxY protein
MERTNDLLLSKGAVDAVSYQVIGAAIAVHKKLGRGLLESVYQKCLAYELTARNVCFVEGLVTPTVQ